jgi:hypothetical protein
MIMLVAVDGRGGGALLVAVTKVAPTADEVKAEDFGGFTKRGTEDADIGGGCGL